jgi:hypothetical protein
VDETPPSCCAAKADAPSCEAAAMVTSTGDEDEVTSDDQTDNRCDGGCGCTFCCASPAPLVTLPNHPATLLGSLDAGACAECASSLYPRDDASRLLRPPRS